MAPSSSTPSDPAEHHEQRSALQRAILGGALGLCFVLLAAPWAPFAFWSFFPENAASALLFCSWPVWAAACLQARGRSRWLKLPLACAMAGGMTAWVLGGVARGDSEGPDVLSLFLFWAGHPVWSHVVVASLAGGAVGTLLAGAPALVRADAGPRRMARGRLRGVVLLGASLALACGLVAAGARARADLGGPLTYSPLLWHLVAAASACFALSALVASLQDAWLALRLGTVLDFREHPGFAAPPGALVIATIADPREGPCWVGSTVRRLDAGAYRSGESREALLVLASPPARALSSLRRSAAGLAALALGHFALVIGLEGAIARGGRSLVVLPDLAVEGTAGGRSFRFTDDGRALLVDRSPDRLDRRQTRVSQADLEALVYEIEQVDPFRIAREHRTLADGCSTVSDVWEPSSTLRLRVAGRGATFVTQGCQYTPGLHRLERISALAWRISHELADEERRGVDPSSAPR